MTDRLKQLWSGFEGVTTRHLTGSGVDNIVAPRRQDWKADDAAFLPDNYSAPAQVAFDALKTRLASQEHKANKRNKKRGKKSEFNAEAALSDDMMSFGDAPESAKDMIRGLKATEDRVMRSSASYVAYMSSEAGRELDSLKKKRKKFLGLF